MAAPPPVLPTTTLLAGKTVVITGSSRGIGRACALQCAANGADVVLHHYGDEITKGEVIEIAAEIQKLGRKSVEVGGVSYESSWHLGEGSRSVAFVGLGFSRRRRDGPWVSGERERLLKDAVGS